jgi:hypothetical protein
MFSTIRKDMMKREKEQISSKTPEKLNEEIIS